MKDWLIIVFASIVLLWSVFELVKAMDEFTIDMDSVIMSDEQICFCAADHEWIACWSIEEREEINRPKVEIEPANKEMCTTDATL